MRVALYARVSTGRQAEEGLSIAAQLAEMEDFARARNWTEGPRFIDPGHSGSSLDRPGVQEMLLAARQKSFDVLLVHELSRLSRSIFDTFRIFEELGNLDVGFASVKDPDFDFSNPTSRFFLAMMAAIHQYYLDQLRQHVAKSKRQRARQGLYNGIGARVARTRSQPPSRGRLRRDSPRQSVLGDEDLELLEANVSRLPQCVQCFGAPLRLPPGQRTPSAAADRAARDKGGTHGLRNCTPREITHSSRSPNGCATPAT